MKRGYIKLWRKSFDSAVWANINLWRTWCCCLMLSNHKGKWVDIEGISEPIKIESGQFITGRFSFYKKMYPNKKKSDPSPLTVQRWLRKLEKLGNLNIKTYNKYSIITISNWEHYQQNEQRVNNRRTTGEQQVNTNKNDKEDIYQQKGFDLFWELYPKKKQKGQALKTWLKLHKKNRIPSLEILKKAIAEQKSCASWKKENGQFIPYPSTWLNRESWLDETDKPKYKYVDLK